MVKLQSASVDRAMELQPPPEPGKPYSIPLPGSAVPGRSAVYRHWRFADGLLESLDPKVRDVTALGIPNIICMSRFELRTTSLRKLVSCDILMIQRDQSDIYRNSCQGPQK